MNKFNKKNRSFQKERRAKKSAARKQKGRPQLQQVVQVVSGKKQRKLDNKWKRAQKEVLDSGLVTMQDIEMLVAENEEEAAGEGSRPSVANASGSGKGRVKVQRKLKVHLKQRKVRVRIRGSVKPTVREQGAEGGSGEEMMMME